MSRTTTPFSNSRRGGLGGVAVGRRTRRDSPGRARSTTSKRSGEQRPAAGGDLGRVMGRPVRESCRAPPRARPATAVGDPAAVEPGGARLRRVRAALVVAVLREVRRQRDLQAPRARGRTGRRSRPGRRAISGRRRCRSRTAPRRPRSRRPSARRRRASAGRSRPGSPRPAARCRSARTRARARSAASSASPRARIVSSAARAGASAPRRRARSRSEASSAPSSPKCSVSVVTTSSSGRRRSPDRTMLQPSVVDVVSATFSGGTQIVAARPARTRSRSASIVSMYGMSAAAALEVGELLGRHRLDRRARERAHRAGVQVRDLVEDGELRAGVLEVHSSSSIGGVVRQQHAVSAAPLVGPDARSADGVGAAHGDVVDPGPGLRIVVQHPVRCHGVEVARDHDRVARACASDSTNGHRAPQLGRGDPRVSERPRRVQVGDDEAVGRGARPGRCVVPSPRPVA